MSRVTNLIITFSSLDDDQRIVEEMKRFDNHGMEFLISSVKDEKLPQHWYGGTRALECNVLIGAYNYLELEHFLDFLRENIRWEALDLVQLFVKEENDVVFKLINLIE